MEKCNWLTFSEMFQESTYWTAANNSGTLENTVYLLGSVLFIHCIASGQPLPVSIDDLSAVGVNNMDDDASVPPAPLEWVVPLVAFTGLQGLVQERPRHFLGSMNLKRSSCSHSEELPPKVAVLLVTVIQSEDSDKKTQSSG